MHAPRFEWDPEKAIRNFEKHGVTFDEAATVFTDPLARESADAIHSGGEERLIILGRSYRQRVLVVVFTEVEDNLLRIIHARRASKGELREYAEEE